MSDGVSTLDVDMIEAEKIALVKVRELALYCPIDLPIGSQRVNSTLPPIGLRPNPTAHNTPYRILPREVSKDTD